MKRVICPFHLDTNPSMVIYSEWAHCFVCHAHVLTSELTLPNAFEERVKQDPVDLPRALSRINNLPRADIRGFYLPYDKYGYYILWPNGDYYKRRNYDEAKGRYTSPAGIKKPLFVYPGSAKHLIIVEGELNAMSLHDSVYGEYKICSPGPATDMMRYIKYYLQFKFITIIVDHDAPGVVFGVSLKEMLLKERKRVNLITVKVDYNELYQNGGADLVKSQFEKDMK